MLIWTLLSLGVIATVVGIIVDLKIREVPDWSNYALIASALSVRLIAAINLQEWNLFLEGVYGLAIAIALGYIFYYAKFWGGGDSKLLMGLGAVIGFSLSQSAIRYGMFLLAIFLLGAVYSFLWMVYEALKKKKKFSSTFYEYLKKYIWVHRILLIILIIGLFGSIFFWPIIILAIMPLLLFYLLIFAQSVEESCFLVKKKTNQLVLGDWLADDVYSKGKIILNKTTIEEEELEILKKHQIKEVLIKEGVPFTPSFLLSLGFIMFIDYFYSFV